MKNTRGSKIFQDFESGLLQKKNQD